MELEIDWTRVNNDQNSQKLARPDGDEGSSTEARSQDELDRTGRVLWEMWAGEERYFYFIWKGTKVQSILFPG